MSHSTHVGFRAPDVSETIMESINCFPLAARRWIAGIPRLPLSLSSVADGVGQSLKWPLGLGLPLTTWIRSPRPPLSPIVAVGVGSKKLRGERPADLKATAFVLLASGVGNNPEAVSAVRGANGGSRNAVPLRIEPDLGKVSENTVQPSTKQRCDVLHDRVAGSKFANETGVLRPKSGASAVDASALPCKANVLAREAAADDVDANSIGSKSSCREGSDVVIDGHLGPVLVEDTARERFDLAERDGLEPASALEPEGEPADAREQVEDAQGFAHDKRSPSFVAPVRALATKCVRNRRTLARRRGAVMGDAPRGTRRTGRTRRSRP